ncbi:DUF397 domain-containing protein [Nocardia beijingensis]|uniref:DUF397 domain-containing protein n=1 Tax=Nocardia beijingensis TaxID=95162 RepID=UPI0033272863
MTIDLSDSKWFKSTHSGTANECVEVAWLEAGHIGVRDSKNPTGPALIFAPGQWDAFADRIRDGEFDRPA